MTNTPKEKRARRAAKKQPEAPANKLDRLAQLITRDGGASLAELMAQTGWQAHSVRGAVAGALKRGRGLNIVSEKRDGERTYLLASTNP